MLQIQTPVFQYWNERRIKAELSSASLNLCSSNASYLQGETIKGSFYLSLSLSLTLVSLVVPTEPCQVNTLRYKKTTQKYLKLKPPDRTPFVSQPITRDLPYTEILTGAPNGEGREDKTYKLSKKKLH